ncbi:anthranilate phosphoribosyltransferase [Lacticaseibacillus sharpeae]|uniref:Anthranilate phosphoribosyltransferase n=1 Tax=Lacticaseibacillus sharpeae JCM 1186 = DSM 20505 TaxID=1291052 RepID=A0A0R1ZLC1_9LACO|nr:anthranilate phosphoribosyltransferase [Lacticaseibacillus sharpeae]KRM55793.1 anthranilate phosphoribosyltransferase [Lacticaseibacillus sharpeae JCM 1186 = DSM 20505]
MIAQTIQTLATGHDLTFAEAEAVINEIMDGNTSNTQIAALLTALTMKGETVPEIAGAASAMRAHALPFNAGENVLEIVGTGGDHANTFNISTTTSIVVAAAGTPVAKHGNRAASSKSGAADVLEALGVNINADPAVSEQTLRQTGICFLFAQEYHQAMRFVGPVRKELGIRTIFNILGPLANPAHATAQLLGVYDAALLDPLAHVLAELGVKNALVVHGEDGLDEVTTAAATDIVTVRNGEFTRSTITPEEFGLQRAQLSDLVGGTPAENAAITRAILAGEPGPKLDTVLLNAACALHAAHADLSIKDALQLARTTIASGAATAKLNELITATNQAISA